MNEALSIKGKKAEGALPMEFPPKNRVELIIYDNDGPEGLFVRLHFMRSWQAIKFLMSEFSLKDLAELSNCNFSLINYWDNGNEG